MNDGQGYPVCDRCRRRIDLEDDDLCAECTEIVKREQEADSNDR